MEQIIFYILAVVIIGMAFASVTSKKMLRSVIYLLFVLMGIAGLYFLLDYNFLAAVQLTVYAGGVIVLVIFSVFLIHHLEMELEMANLRKKIIAALISIGGIATFLWVIWNHHFNVVENYNAIEVRDIGLKLLSTGDGGFILPFEVISILLLAAMIGAIIVAKSNKLTDKNEAQS
ncbi:MAG: NADH-quinone oxidoreductase subunit J [Flavobacteriaceae bacterium]|nr:NADH-quinone oxidoreductase subunit J [Flavobacteriaceae bacterium]